MKASREYVRKDMKENGLKPSFKERRKRKWELLVL